MNDVFEILAKIGRDRQLELLVIGGYAMQAYGSARQTLDADVLATDQTATLLETILSESGYRSTARTGNFVRLRHSESRMQDIDILFVDEATMRGMIAESRHVAFENSKLRVPALNHLIALKLHAMKNDPARKPRDVADIVDLLRLHRSGVPDSELRALCEKYGPAGIFEQITCNLS